MMKVTTVAEETQNEIATNTPIRKSLVAERIDRFSNAIADPPSYGSKGSCFCGRGQKSSPPNR